MCHVTVVVQIFAAVLAGHDCDAVGVYSGFDAVHEVAAHGVDHKAGQAAETGLDLFLHAGVLVLTGCCGLSEQD